MLRIMKQMIVVPLLYDSNTYILLSANAVLIISVHILNPFCSLNDVETILTGCRVKKSCISGS
jgi:hypothetical protein